MNSKRIAAGAMLVAGGISVAYGVLPLLATDMSPVQKMAGWAEVLLGFALTALAVRIWRVSR